MWTSSADMSISWSKMMLLRITYFDHVGKVLTCAIYGAKRRFRKTLKIVMCASSADMSNSRSEMVLSRITYFDHVGL